MNHNPQPEEESQRNEQDCNRLARVLTKLERAISFRKKKFKDERK